MVSEEYFYHLNKQNSCWEVCHIIFNSTHPNGFTRLVYRAKYGKDGCFSFRDAKKFAKKLVKYFNGKKFRRMRVY